jgi:uncharacterized protein YyaL (SSP411 family)
VLAGDLAAARDVARWLMEFMRSPEGAFYTSQDADAGKDLHGDKFYAQADAERRAGPQPPIDRNLYARENGWAVASFAALYDVTDDQALLDAARRAFDWTMANRRAPNGGFGHGRAADDDTHLGDTLAMAEAALALYRSTAERRYLALAIELAGVIVRDHRDPPVATTYVGPSRARAACWQSRCDRSTRTSRRCACSISWRAARAGPSTGPRPSTACAS